MLESLNFANAGVPNNRPYAPPKQLSRRAVLESRYWCQTCEEVQVSVDYCSGQRMVELACGHWRSL